MASRKDSSSSDSSDSIEFGIGVPGGSGIGAIAAPVAPVIQMPPIVQFDQKKVPTYWFEESKDGLSIAEWIKRVDGMRVAMDWTDAATYHNAKNALFGAAATIMNTQCQKTVNDDFAETWTWLKKKLRKQFGDCTSSREYVDIIFKMKPQTDLKTNPVVTASHIYGEFDKIKNAIPDNNFNVAAGGPVARDEVKQLLDAEKIRICDAFAFAFMVNLLPAAVRTKVLDKDPQTIAETVDYIKDAYRSVVDEKRPLGMPATLHANITEIAAINGDMSRMEAMMTNMFNNKFKQYEQKGNFKKKKNQNQGNQSGQNNAGGGAANKVVKQCTYCGKKNHGQLTCFKRKGDKAPCINANGEPYWPKEDEAKANAGSTPPAQPTIS